MQPADELLTLLERLCNDQLSADEHARLQELLRDDPQARETYLAYVDLHLALKQVCGIESGGGLVPAADSRCEPLARQKRAKNIISAALATLAVVATIVVAIIALTRNGGSPSMPPTLKLTQVAGTVAVKSAGGPHREASIGMPILPGDQIRTEGDQSLAVLTFDDGTRIALVNDSSLTWVAGDHKSVVVHHGIVSAQVTPQPARHPMLLSTPGANIEVVGTQFALAANNDRTELNVIEGRVRLTRVSDGQSVEIAEGQGVVTNGEVALKVHDTTAPSDSWNVDFESGVPEGWLGATVTENLPDLSQGAIQPVRQDETEPVILAIAAREEWLRGLFVVHDDTHLHFRLRMDHPDWLNVFLFTRGSDATNPTWAMHNFNEVPFWPPKPGVWRTVTIPLSQFRRKRDGEFHRGESPLVGEVAYSFSITSTEPDRGLVIDRIWATRGGPGKVTITP